MSRLYRLSTDGWYLERIMFLIYGVVVSLSLLLAWLISPYWLILAAVPGISSTIFALTGYCPCAVLLGKLGATPRLGKT